MFDREKKKNNQNFKWSWIGRWTRYKSTSRIKIRKIYYLLLFWTTRDQQFKHIADSNVFLDPSWIFILINNTHYCWLIDNNGKNQMFIYIYRWFNIPIDNLVFLFVHTICELMWFVFILIDLPLLNHKKKNKTIILIFYRVICHHYGFG